MVGPSLQHHSAALPMQRRSDSTGRRPGGSRHVHGEPLDLFEALWIDWGRALEVQPSRSAANFE
jgi:hypothetical protein